MLVLMVSGILFFISGGLLIWGYSAGKAVYEDFVEPLDQKEYSTKDLLPAGLFLNDKLFRLENISLPQLRTLLFKYSMDIKSQVTELCGAKYSDYFYVIHNANKTVYALGLLALATGLSLLMYSTGDMENAQTFLVFGILLGGGTLFLNDKGLKDKIEKRRFSIMREFPDFVNKLTLLVNAGMTISKAWEKIIIDNKKNTPLYMEMNFAFAQINAGKPEAMAYEEFARRCKVKEILKFVSVIVVNLRKGGSEVVVALKQQANECWEMRKASAKRLGEEASTKILLPLMIMFVAILVIVATPALLQMSSMY